MKTVLKNTKRFAAVFLALAMVVLSLPSSLMTTYATTSMTLDKDTVTISGYVNEPITPETFTVTSDGTESATTWALSGAKSSLPDGLSVGEGTGDSHFTYTITGTPTAACGNTSTTLAAANDTMKAEATINWSILAQPKVDTVTPNNSTIKYTNDSGDVPTTNDVLSYSAATVLYIAPENGYVVDGVTVTNATTGSSAGGTWSGSEGTTAPSTYTFTAVGDGVYNVVVTTATAPVSNTVTIQEPDNVDVEVTGDGWNDSTKKWSEGDLTITYAITDDEYTWGVEPKSFNRFSVKEGDATKTLNTDAGYDLAWDDETATATITLASSLIGATAKTITINTLATAVAKSGGITLNKTTDSLEVKAGETIDTNATSFKSAHVYTATVNGGGTVTWGLYKDEAGTETADIAGLSLTADGNSAYLSGTPTAIKASGPIYAIATYGTGASAQKGVVTITYEATARVLDTDFQIVDEDGFKVAAPTMAFGEKAVGYNVSTITGKTVRVKNISTVDIPGVTFAPASGSDFVVTGFTAGSTLAAGETAVLTVKPASGLLANSSAYEADIQIKSTAVTAETIAHATFTVTSDIAVYLNDDATAAKESANGLSDSSKDIDLGTYTVGDVIDDIKIEVSETGEGTELAWDTSAITTALADAGLGALQNDLQVTAVTTSKTSNGKTIQSFKLNSKGVKLAADTFDTSKTTARSTSNLVHYADGITYYYIPMTAGRSGVSQKYWGVIKVQPAALEVKVGGTTVADKGSYAWSAADNTTANALKEVTIKNTSDADITVAVTHSAANNTGNKINLADSTGSATTYGSLAIAAGETKSVYLLPYTDEDCADVLTIEGASNQGVANYTVNLDFSKLSENPKITTPKVTASKNSKESGEAVAIPTEAVIGEAYSFTFSAESTSSAGVTWKLLANGDDIADGTYYNDGSTESGGSTTVTGALTATEIKEMGLKIGANTGELYATEIVGTKGAKVIAVAATQGSKTVVGYYSLTLNTATNALSLTYNGQAVSSTTGITLPTAGTDTKEQVIEVTVTNIKASTLGAISLNKSTAVANKTADSDISFTWAWADEETGHGTLGTFTGKGTKDATQTLKITIPANVADTYGTVIKLQNAGGEDLFTFPLIETVEAKPIITNSQLTPETDRTAHAVTNLGSGLLTVGTAVAGLKLTASDESDNPLKDANATYSWAPTTGKNSSIPDGLTLTGNTTDGWKISGTPTKAGTFYATITVTNTTTGASGSYDYAITVAAGAAIEAHETTSGGTDLASSVKATPYIFDGVVKGDTLPSALTVVVTTDNATGELNITKEDVLTRADGAKIPAGSAANFTISDQKITNIAAGGNTSFTIRPNSSAKAGTYEAKITISGDKTNTVEFYVQYTVAEKLDAIGLSSINLNKTVGDAITATNGTLLSAGAGDPLGAAALAALGTLGGTPSVTAATDVNSQTVTWYLAEEESEGKTATQNTTASYTALTALGLASGGGAGQIATAEGAEKLITGGYISSTGLKAKGEVTFRLVAKTTAVSEATLKVPAQTAAVTLTLKVDATDKVYVLREADTEYNYGKATGTVGKNLTGFTFNAVPVGKYTGATYATTLKVRNDLADPDLHASITLDGDDKDDFTLTDGGADVTLAKAGVDSNTITIQPKNSLELGSHSAVIVIAPTDANKDAFATLRIPVTITVEATNYAYKLYNYDSTATGNKGAEITNGELDLGTIIKGNDTTVTRFVLENVGNVQPESGGVTFLEVMDAEGTDFGGATANKLLGTIEGKDGWTASTASELTPGTAQNLGMNLSTKGAATLGDHEAYLQITYDGKTPKTDVVKVKWTVVSDKVAGDLSPKNDVSLGTAVEDYTSNYKTTFTIKNTGSANTDVIKNLNIELADGSIVLNEDATALNNTDLAKGASATFSVQVPLGLAADTYEQRLRVSADNMDPVVADLSFVVTNGASLTVKASKTGETITGSQAARLMETLKAMATDSTKGGEKIVYESVAYTNATTTGGTYLVSVNGDDVSSTNYDVKVEYSYSSGRYGTATITTDPAKINVTQFENTITNTVYDASTDLASASAGKFQRVTFDIYEEVVFTVEDTTNNDLKVMKLDGSALDTWDSVYGSVTNTFTYKVPYGSSVAATTVQTEDGISITGMPKLYKVDSSADTTPSATVVFNGWYDQDNKSWFDESKAITKNYGTTPLAADFHTHKYAATATTTDGKLADGTTPKGVSWSWSGTEPNKTATLTLTCLDEECTTDDGKTVTISGANVTIETTTIAATCEKGEHIRYQASVTYNSVTYTDTTEGTVETKPALEHEWVLVEGSEKWSDDMTSVTADFVCKNDKSHTRSATAIGEELHATNVKKPTHTAEGSATFEPVYTLSTGTKTVTIKGEKVTKTIPATGHEYAAKDWVFTESYDSTGKMTGYSSVTATVYCVDGDMEEVTGVAATAGTPKYSHNNQIMEITYTLTYGGKEVDSQTRKVNLAAGRVVEGNNETKEQVGDEQFATGMTAEYTLPDMTYDGNAKTLKNLKVTWTNADGEEIVLTERTDYTVTYKNNKNVGTMQILIKGNGNYQDTVTIERKITPVDLQSDSVTVSNLTVRSAGALETVRPTVYWNGKTLRYNTDYTVTSGEDTVATESMPAYRSYTITGKGNYEGTRTFNAYIIDGKSFLDVKSLNFKVTTKANEIVINRESAIEGIHPAFGLTVKGKNYAPDSFDNSGSFDADDGTFDYHFEGNFKAGTAYLVITAENPVKVDGKTYIGEKVVSFKIKSALTFKTSGKDQNIVITGSAPYTGNPITVADLVNGEEAGGLKITDTTADDEVLTEGEDYTLTYTNNIKAGTAKVTITGIGAYAGQKATGSFKIDKPVVLDTDDSIAIISLADEAVYTKGGTKPVPTISVTTGGVTRTLINGTDFAVTYKNPTGAAGTNVTLTIKGKGNYVFGSDKNIGITRDVKITKSEITTVSFYVKKVYVKYAAANTATKLTNSGKKVPVVVDALTGKTLTNKTDYTFEWVTDSYGTWSDEYPVRTIGVKITGVNNYEGTDVLFDDVIHETSQANNVKLTANMVSAKVIKTYDGSAQTVTVDEIRAANLLGSNVDFSIVPGTYKNNVKQGTATVQLQGEGIYSGTVTYRFTIQKADITAQ